METFSVSLPPRRDLEFPIKLFERPIWEARTMKSPTEQHFAPFQLITPWWRHERETYSVLLALCMGNSPVTGEFPSQRPVTRTLMFSFICAWINGWANNREAGDLRRHCAHYGVIVMTLACSCVECAIHNRHSKDNVCFTQSANSCIDYNAVYHKSLNFVL